MNLTREQIKALEMSDAPRPNKFTGIWKGQHYYKGRAWYGPTNVVGAKYLSNRHRAFEAPEVP